MSEPSRPRKTRSGPSSGSFTVARVVVQELAAAGPEMLEAPATDLLSDELLVDRLAAGESEQYEVLMRRSCARLYRLARGILSDPTAAEEVVCEAFVGAYENLPSFEPRMRFSDWLARIAIHGAVARLRRSEPSKQYSRRVRSQELVRLLEHAVDDLPERLRIAFTLCALDQISVEDAAAALGYSDAEIRQNAFRGRLRVRRQLGQRFDDAEALAFGLDLGSAGEIIAAVLRRCGIGPR